MQILLPLGLAFIMLAMGLTLEVGDFTRLFAHPKAIFLGLLAQIVALPLAAFALLWLWPIEPALAVGVMILAASPGGITSNLLTHLARGDTALSISLTAISSLAGVATLPLVVGASLAWFTPHEEARQLAVGAMVMKVFAVSTLPLIIGMSVNHFAPRAAKRLESLLRPLSVVVFALIVLWAFASSWRVMMDNIAFVGPVMAALNAAIMLLGWGLARAAGLAKAQAVAISLEGGLQNGALGIFVAMTLLHSPTMMIPSITYALFMNISAALLILWSVRRARRISV